MKKTILFLLAASFIAACETSAPSSQPVEPPTPQPIQSVDARTYQHDCERAFDKMLDLTVDGFGQSLAASCRTLDSSSLQCMNEANDIGALWRCESTLAGHVTSAPNAASARNKAQTCVGAVIRQAELIRAEATPSSGRYGEFCQNANPATIDCMLQAESIADVGACANLTLPANAR